MIPLRVSLSRFPFSSAMWSCARASAAYAREVSGLSLRCDVEVFADGFNVAADVGTGDGVGESVVGDGVDGGSEHWCEHFQSALAVDACVLPEFGGDADESGEESTGQDG